MSINRPYVRDLTDGLIDYRDHQVAGKDWKGAFGVTLLTELGHTALSIASLIESVIRGVLAIGAFFISLTRDGERKQVWERHANNLTTSAIHAFAINIENIVCLLANPFADQLQEVSGIFQRR